MSEHHVITGPATAVQPAAGREVMPVPEQTGEQIYEACLQRLPLQRKLAVGAVDDPLEREADEMADKVMRMPQTPFVQRKCAHCEEEEKAQRKPLVSFIQKKGAAGESMASDAVSDRIQSTKGGGSPMPPATKSFMESGFGADFSGVRIHTGDYAAGMSKELNAQAFTVGSDIYFNEGKFSEGSSDGKQLLAHELTHVVQQNGAGPSIQRDVEGTSMMEEHINPVTHAAGSQTWSGTVDRHEFVPARGTTPRRELGTVAGVRIEFDGANCVVNLPMRVKFEHPSAGNWPFCNADSGSPVPPQLSAARFNEIKQRFLALANPWFNGWFTVRLSNCTNSCAGRDIPINASIVEDPTNATTTVIIANKQGRSCATPSLIVLHATDPAGSNITDDRIIHETGHAVLGFPDEYPVSSGNTNPEAVHTGDFSAAGDSSSFGSWMLMQERHFTFVPAFLESIFPGCTATLNANHRSGVAFNWQSVLGYSGFGGGGFHVSTGLDFAFPLDIQRRLQLTLGARAGVVLGLEYPMRNAFMGGLRLGMMYTTNLSSGGLHLGAFGEIGGGRFDGVDRTAASPTVAPFAAGYYSAGGSIGYSGSPGSGRIPFIGVEASYNSLIGMSADDLRRFGPSEWFNIGLTAGFQWH